MPLAGGLNSVQAGMLDVDSDGQDDLVVFERFSRQIRVFRMSNNGVWLYQPFLEKLFPEEVSDWMLLRDFNCDGKPDLFTGDPLGVRVFTNIGSASTGLRWRPYNPGFPLLTKGFTANINLKVNANDIPAIDDIDGDGDLDILATRFVGNSTVEYHKNLSMERTGSCDSLQLERITQNWGGLEECSCGSFAFGEPCPPSAGRTQHTGGKALYTLDIDADGDKDLLFGEEECNQGFLLINRGNTATAEMTDFTDFTSTGSLVFPSFSRIDGNLDGIPDLLTSTNLAARTDNQQLFTNSVRFMASSGSSQPVFAAPVKGFLQQEMIDLGDQAFPAVFDLDGDGDEDLLTGTWRGGLSFFENTGVPGDPDLRLRSEDFLGLHKAGYYNIRPQLTDLTADGIADLVFTATFSETGTTQLYLIPNTTAPGFRGEASQLKPLGFGMGAKDNLLMYDISGDGRPDIITFNSQGSLTYFRQTADETFVAESEDLYTLGTDPLRARSPLHAADVDGDGEEDLIIGTATGNISVLFQFRKPTREFRNVQVRNTLSGEAEEYQPGGYVHPVVGHWFRESRASLLAGTVTGGFILLRPESVASLPAEPVVRLFPNPISDGQSLNIRADRAGIVTVYSVLGQRVGEPRTVPASVAVPVHLPDLAPGVYLIRFSTGNQQKTQRLIRR